MSFAIGGGRGRAVHDALKDILLGAERVSIAVSYIQRAGWELLRALLRPGQLTGLRILCTDQLGITDPAAIRAIMHSGVDVRAFVPTGIVYHPKLYLAHQVRGSARFLLGSANLSKSALESGVEIDVSGEDAGDTLANWFDAIFADASRCAPFDAARLAALDKAWEARLKSRLVYQRAVSVARRPAASDLGAASAVETAFADLSPGVTPLNFDKAGNNVRQMGMISDLLAGRRRLEGKARSEMKLMGFVENGQLNALGRRAARIGTDAGIAAAWAGWLKAAPESDLLSASPSGHLLRARQAFRAFWSFPAEVTGFFIANAHNPPERIKRVMQTIELLANTGRDLSQLSLADIETLAAVLDNRSALRPEAAEAVRDYLENKGRRGWRVADRRLAVEAWRHAP